MLHLANRPEFIAADTVQKFEAETGIAVTYDLYQSDEAMAASLAAGNPRRWDLVVVSTVPVLAKGVGAGWFAPMETQKLANFGNLDTWVLDRTAPSDPGNRYGVPYLWGTAGLGINSAKLHETAADAPLDSLSLVFDPAQAARLAACGVAIEDEPADAIPAALAFLGLDPTSQLPHDLDQAGELLLKLKPVVRRLDSDDFIEALASGAVCVGFGSSIDVADARTRSEERNAGVELTYVVPKERARMWVDVMAIPAGSAHADEARALIDFLLRPEIISDITDWTAAVNPNTLAADFVDDDKTDETVFPSPESRERLFLDRPLSAEAAALRTRIWTKSKP